MARDNIRLFSSPFTRLAVLLYLLAAAAVAAAPPEAEAEAAVSRFREYLRIDTAQPQPDYAGAAAFLRSEADALGLEAETLEFALREAPRPPPMARAPPLPPLPPPQLPHRRRPRRAPQDMKCVGMQYLEAIRRLRAAGFTPDRTIYLSFVPDEEIGGKDGAGAFASSSKFEEMNVGLVLDEGLASPGEEYRVFYGERCPWWLVIKARGAPGHGAKLYDGSAMENLMKSVEIIRRFRAAQFDLVKAGVKAEGEVVSVNLVYLKAGTPSPTGFVMNLQPSEAQVGLDVRVPPNANPEELERRIAEEWAPSSRNMTFEFKQKVSVYDMFGKPVITPADNSNPWWTMLEEAIRKANVKLGKPEIFPASTDARYFRERGIPAFGFSPMANTPILLHDHNEFLNKDEYIKGIEIYESVIRGLASYNEHAKDEESRAEL
ncbi:Aminoacylase-1 [Ananas comosus]|uniref:Aminoacylase-1 n=1 Tax=Ananas comosus TaxID=4615 RepID=A0A199V1G2_ANACO|nr:Aminoacylase-1 [Ananas comosus]